MHETEHDVVQTRAARDRNVALASDHYSELPWKCLSDKLGTKLAHRLAQIWHTNLAQMCQISLPSQSNLAQT
jgi:hypothetical protein